MALDTVVGNAASIAGDVNTFLPGYDVLHWVVKFTHGLLNGSEYRVGNGAFGKHTFALLMASARKGPYKDPDEIRAILSSDRLPAFFALSPEEDMALGGGSQRRVPWVVSQMSASDMTNNDASNVNLALRILSLSTACMIVDANLGTHGQRTLDGDTFLAIMVYLTAGRRIVLSQTSPSLGYSVLDRIRTLSTCTAIFRALILDREHRADDGAAGQTVHTPYVLAGLEKNHARLVTQTLVGSHFAILRQQHAAAAAATATPTGASTATTPTPAPGADPVPSVSGPVPAGTARSAAPSAAVIELRVEQTCTATTQPNESFHGRVRTRSGRGTAMSDATVLDVYGTIVDEMVLAKVGIDLPTRVADYRRSHITDGGILSATSVGPTFAISGGTGSELFRDATLKVLDALWHGWRDGFCIIQSLVSSWDLSTDPTRVFVYGFDVEVARELLNGASVLASLKVLQPPPPFCKAHKDLLLQWASYASVVLSSSEKKETKEVVHARVDRARDHVATKDFLAWYQERQYAKENRIWGVIQSLHATAEVGVEGEGSSGLVSRNQVRQWLAHSMRQSFDGRMKKSRQGRYGSSTHRRLSINHVYVAGVIDELRGRGLEGEEGDHVLWLGMVVAFFDESVEAVEQKTGFGIVTQIPGKEMFVDTKQDKRTGTGTGKKKKKTVIAIRRLDLDLETDDGDYYTVSIVVGEVPLDSVIGWFPPTCELPTQGPQDHSRTETLPMELQQPAVQPDPDPDPYGDDEPEEHVEDYDGFFHQIFVSTELKAQLQGTQGAASSQRREEHEARRIARHGEQSQDVGHPSNWVPE